MDHPDAIRLLDGVGRIVIPRDMRAALNWEERTPVDIIFNAEGGEIILRRHMLSCSFCGSEENLLMFDNRYICRACQTAITRL